MRPETIKNQTVLLSPLNWGMGHVARCIPIIHQLLKQENKLIVACNDVQEKIFKTYFPQVIYLYHEGYPFKFKGKGNFERDLLVGFSHLKKHLKKEKADVERFVEQYNVNLVISDHRYGFISKKCPSVFITHQINLPVPWYIRFVDQLHKKLIRSFDTVWILDTPDSHYAGKLSINLAFKQVEYIGPQSRFSLYPKRDKIIPVVVIISGPEPYAEQFFREQYQIAEKRNEKTVFIVPSPYISQIDNDKIELILSSDWKITDHIILNAQKIISRSGYSTIMDLSVLETEAELIATPGQKEQEHLIKHLSY